MGRRVLAVLLLAMAAGQLSDVAGFVDILEAYRFGGRGAAWAFAAVVMAAELAAGVHLLRPSAEHRSLGASLGVAVAVAWTILAGQAFARGLALDNCGCFGVHLGQPLRWWVLLEDAELIALAVWVRRKSSDAPVEDHELASA